MFEEAMGCPVDDLEAQIVDVRRRHRRCEYELSCLLVAWDQRECARSRGDTDTGGWAMRVLNLSRRETAELLRIGRRIPDLPHVRGAFEEGHLGWTQVREIVRVAEPETDEAWTARAREVSSRRLEREVAACRRGDTPPDFEDMELPSRVVLRFDVATGDAMVIRKALSVLRAQAGDQGDLDDGVLLATLARTSLRDGDSPERPMPEERYRVVLEKCPKCAHTTHVGQTDGVHRVDVAVAAEAACDHERVDATGRLTHAIPPRARRRVLHRDRYRCIVPHCGADVWVEVLCAAAHNTSYAQPDVMRSWSRVAVISGSWARIHVHNQRASSQASRSGSRRGAGGPAVTGDGVPSIAFRFISRSACT